MKRWREYYQKFTNEANPGDGRNEQQSQVDDIAEIIGAVIKKTLRNLKNWKTIGPDNWPEECGRV